ncbi:hypothetical protein P4S81_12505 [Pseudoalteromonas sp. B28]|uniref:DUF6624 domain-containing protein n=1 Tax=unclassified Pseudoalteromonas TaxID=194690 RepID=UPI0015FBFCEA|nr:MULTISPECIES: DUF6624 domain-containing protein [unclassified Pseudoalteromonas]MBB1306518.1 hypothetical protein [Pseudoalteromonas sp. SR43-5]MBB1354963.1 hypothetical protein [Pseudoalteromonas sp. SR45-5]MBB1400709.1 hypothetical protein [Pseudoalteromonas sp. SG45-1]
MRYLFLLLIIPLHSFAEINLPLQKELIEMEIEDQHIRNKIGEAGWQNPPKALLEQMMKIDESNTGKLKAIIKKHHWLTRDLVGVKGVGAAFLVIQHSPDVAFKVKMLPYLKQSYLNGEGVSGQQVALLTDRVLIAQGKKQIYGTQADVSEGKVVFSPIEDETNVDIRREEMNMPSLDFYLKIMEKMYGIKEHPEIDLN